MSNAVRAEIYKLENSKMLRAFLIVTIIVSLGALATRYLVYVLPVLSYLIIFMLAVFTSFNVPAGFANGVYRNAIASGTQRWRLYFAKLASSFLAGSCMVAAATVILSIGAIFSGGWARPYTPDSAAVAFLAYLLFLCAYTTVFNMVSFLVRRQGAVMAVNLFIYFAELIASTTFRDAGSLSLLPSTYIAALFPQPFSASFYSGQLFDTLLKGLILAAATVGIAAAAGCLAFKNSEIR